MNIQCSLYSFNWKTPTMINFRALVKTHCQYFPLNVCQILQFSKCANKTILSFQMISFSIRLRILKYFYKICTFYWKIKFLFVFWVSVLMFSCFSAFKPISSVKLAKLSFTIEMYYSNDEGPQIHLFLNLIFALALSLVICY